MEGDPRRGESRRQTPGPEEALGWEQGPWLGRLRPIVCRRQGQPGLLPRFTDAK